LGTLGPSSRAMPAQLPLPSVSLLPSFSGPCRRADSSHEAAWGMRECVHRARRVLPGPPRGDGAGQGPTGPPLAPLSTEKYLPRAGGGLVGLARKGQGGGKATASPARVMYWMKSVGGTSPCCSMLSLAARCRWKWCLFGEPIQRKLCQPDALHLPHTSVHSVLWLFPGLDGCGC
jgi:hypothetical protein